MRLKDYFHNSNGSFIVGLLIAAAVLSGVALFYIDTIKTQTKSATFSAVKLDEYELKRQIEILLQDSIACKNTFNGKMIGDSIPFIKNSDNVNIISDTDTFSDSKGNITSLKTKDLNNFLGSVRDIQLEVGIRKKIMAKSMDSVLNIPLKATALGATDLISNCFSDSVGVISQASLEGCITLGGFWNSTLLSCDLPSYVKKSGGNMTGALSISSGNLLLTNGELRVDNGNISMSGNLMLDSSAQICIGTTCQNFSAKTCGVDEVAIGISGNGELVCDAIVL